MNRGGNNAYQYDYDDNNDYSYEYLPDRKNMPGYELPEEKIKKTEVVLREIKKKNEDKKIKRSIITHIAVLVFLGLTVAFRYASVTQINYENHKLQKEYKQLNAIAENMEVDIESSMSITEIANIAENKLGMHKPFSYQIKYINVETPDQTEHINTNFTKEENEKLTLYQRIKNELKLFFGLI